MMEFRAPEPADKPWVDELLARRSDRGCDYNFTNIFVWKKAYGLEIGRFEDFLTVHLCGRMGCSYMYPAGSGDIAGAIRAIEAVLGTAAKPDGSSYVPAVSYDMENGRPKRVGCVREEALTYGTKKQGEYTLEDYYALPDDQRVELIDGVFYNMSAPTLLHQQIGGEIHRQIANHIMEHKGKCIPFIAPVDVQLDRDERTMVEPDVGILCDRDKRKGGIIFGAPEFLVEILSPSTRKKDMTLKLQKYANAGVREYWMVDIKKRTILTYFFEADDYPVIYGFEDQIPVRIYDGALSVDMSLMLPWIEENLEEQ